VPEPGCREVEAGLAVRERADDAGPAPDLSHQPLERIVGADAPPMLFRKGIVGECLGDRVVDKLRGAGAAEAARRSGRLFGGVTKRADSSESLSGTSAMDTFRPCIATASGRSFYLLRRSTRYRRGILTYIIQDFCCIRIVRH
jgi:hypothetical protein